VFLGLVLLCALAFAGQDGGEQESIIQEVILQEVILEETVVEEAILQDEPVAQQETPPPDASDSENEPEPEAAVVSQVEWMYIRVNGAMLYSSKSMKASRAVGTVTGIALALHYMEDSRHTEDHRGEAVRAIYVTEDGVLHDGIFAAHDIQWLDYQEAIRAIGGDICRCYADSEVWPLPGAAFAPVERERTSEPVEAAMEEEIDEPAPAPYVVITGNTEGKLIPGASVVLTAQVFYLDEDRIDGYRWLRVVDGELQEVPGVTGSVCSFLAGEENADCQYVVEVQMH